MRRALVMWCVLAAAACRSGGEPAPAVDPSATSASPPANTAPPSATAPPVTATPPSTTAPPVPPRESGPRESASPGATAPRESAPPEASPPRHSTLSRSTPGPQCQKDADCALTLVPEGDCCPKLCAPRAVTLEEARRVDERVRRCEQENRTCVLPNCRARAFEPSCMAGLCAARLADDR